VLTNAAIGIHGCRQWLEQDARVRGCRVNPPGKSGMPISLWIGEQHFAHKTQRLLEWLALLWQHLMTNHRAHIVWHGLPDRVILDVGEIGRHLINDLISQISQLSLTKRKTRHLCSSRIYYLHFICFSIYLIHQGNFSYSLSYYWALTAQATF